MKELIKEFFKNIIRFSILVVLPLGLIILADYLSTIIL